MYNVASTSKREPYGTNDMIYKKELDKARMQALLSKDTPPDAPVCSLTPPLVEKNPKESRKQMSKNHKKHKLVQHDQSTKSPNADLLFDPGLETICSRERPFKRNAWKTRASQPQVVEKPRYFNAFNKKRSKRMDECRNLNMHGSVASKSMNARSNSVAYNSASEKCVHDNMNCENMNANTNRTVTSNLRKISIEKNGHGS